MNISRNYSPRVIKNNNKILDDNDFNCDFCNSKNIQVLSSKYHEEILLKCKTCLHIFERQI